MPLDETLVPLDKRDARQKRCLWTVSLDKRCLLSRGIRVSRQDLILVAFITGNSSLEPLIEGLYAQIHVNLRVSCLEASCLEKSN